MIYTDSNGIVYKLNTEFFTAKISKSQNAKGDIIIPYSIKYKNKDYLIDGLENSAFINNKEIKSIFFHENSQIRSFGINAFSFSTIQSLQFPKNLEVLGNNWCSLTKFLNKIEISLDNSNFRYLDQDQKIILGKTDKKGQIFDTIVFVCRDTEKVTVPSYIKHIENSAFHQCQKMTDFQIGMNSKLETIGTYCFGSTIFKTVKFPPTLKRLGEGIFSQSRIENCEFDENCSIEKFPNSTFISSAIRTLTIPKNVFEFERKWAFNTQIKTIILSPKNKNLCYLDNEHKIIAGKSNKNLIEFDILYFACRDVKTVFIPSNIKFIYDYAFDQCHELETLQFENKTSILSIGNECFRECKELKSVTFPAGLKRIGKGCFSRCFNLNLFEFHDKIIYIDSYFFSSCYKLNTVYCPNAERIIYNNVSFNYLEQNITFKCPKNTIISYDKNVENNEIRKSFEYNVKYIFSNKNLLRKNLTISNF